MYVRILGIISDRANDICKSDIITKKIFHPILSFSSFFLIYRYIHLLLFIKYDRLNVCWWLLACVLFIHIASEKKNAKCYCMYIWKEKKKVIDTHTHIRIYIYVLLVIVLTSRINLVQSNRLMYMRHEEGYVE